MGGAVAETVEAVNPCAECGYDLGPNYIEAYDGDTCPECGTPFERTNLTPEPSRRRYDDDDDDDEPTMAEQCEVMLENDDTVRLGLNESVMADSHVEFDWPDGWDWDRVRDCRVYDDYVQITWTDGSESSIDRPGLDIDASTIEAHGSWSIFSPDGEMWDEC